MIFDLVGSVGTILVLLVGFVVRPSRADCPLRWHLEGVKPSGSYLCRPNGGPSDADEASPPGWLRGRVYCTGGTVPVTRDGRAIGCMRVSV
ncbi:MAG: hypothetical protein H0T79_13080 [Deltaproteobacteria bacterium]|nr:hypothetical protein [Deltaproteobacteria bacterium]